MKGTHDNLWALLPRLTLMAALLFAAPAAVAQLAEDTTRLPTDGAVTHVFPYNPAVNKPAGTRAGVLVVRDQRATEVDHSSQGGAKIKSDVTNESWTAGVFTDLGAGAGVGISHQALFYRAETKMAGDREAHIETTKVQHSVAKLAVELTNELRVGVAMRYLFKDVVVYGDFGLGTGEETRYRTTMVGYGSGLTYSFSSGGIGYTYFPPLRGKADVAGEERIVVEAGEISVDGFYSPVPGWRIGLLGKRWINELDDLATGTTAADNRTNISLNGLDPDQYLVPTQLIMLGADYEMTKITTVRFALGREDAAFNLKDRFVYNRLDLRQRGSGDEKISYNRLRAMLRFNLNKGIEANIGLGFYKRNYDFPDGMGGGSYAADGKELFATIAVGI